MSGVPGFTAFSKVRSALDKFLASEDEDPRLWSKLRESETCETDVVASVEPMIWVELAYRRPESGKRGKQGSVDVYHTAVDIDGHAPAVGVLATQMGSGHCSILLCPVAV